MSKHQNSTPTVYIVDDESSIRHSLMMMIESLSLPVKCFSNADEFLNACDPSFSGCLILDIRMPGMSGFELHDRLLAQGLRIPVIVISGHGDPAMARGATSEGLVEFLEKPFQPERLVEAIGKAMAHSGPME